MPQRARTSSESISPKTASERADSVSDWLALAELLSVCSHSLRSEVAARALGAAVTEPQFALLRTCARSTSGLSQSELADGLALSAAHVSGMVEQLSARGLVVGQRDSNDRRRQCWRLTDAGRAIVELVIRELLPWCETLDANFECVRRQQLAVALRALAPVIGGCSMESRVLPIGVRKRDEDRSPAPSSNRALRARSSAGGAA